MDKNILGNAFLKVWINKKLVTLTNENIKLVRVEDIEPNFYMDADSISQIEHLVPNEYNGVTKNQFFVKGKRISADKIKKETSPQYFLVEDKKTAEYRKTQSNNTSTNPF